MRAVQRVCIATCDLYKSPCKLGLANRKRLFTVCPLAWERLLEISDHAEQPKVWCGWRNCSGELHHLLTVSLQAVQHTASVVAEIRSWHCVAAAALEAWDSLLVGSLVFTAKNISVLLTNMLSVLSVLHSCRRAQPEVGTALC